MTADSHMDRSLSARVADIRGRLDADSPEAAEPGSTPRASGREKGRREKGGRERMAPGRAPARRPRRQISPLTPPINAHNLRGLVITVQGHFHHDH